MSGPLSESLYCSRPDSSSLFFMIQFCDSINGIAERLIYNSDNATKV